MLYLSTGQRTRFTAWAIFHNISITCEIQLCAGSCQYTISEKQKKKKKEWKLGTGGRRFGSGLSLERALSPQALCSQTLGLPLALAVLGQQPSDGTRQLQGLIFANVL